MTESGAQTPPPDNLISTPSGGHAERVSTVIDYLRANRERFTEEALIRAARDRGYPDDVLEEARIGARGTDVAAPTVRLARRWIIAAYLLTFAVLTIGMFASEYSRQYGANYIGTGVLTVTLGLAFLISLGWLSWRGRHVGSAATGFVLLLSLPLVLLVTVTGLCVMTGLPIPRPY